MNSKRKVVIGLLIAMGVVFAGVGSVSAQTAADADFDDSGEVGFQDFLLFAAKFNTARGDADYDARFDLDDSGEVGFADFLTFARFFGETAPVPALALTGIAPSEGMPGTLIELVGQFDGDTAYQVKFGTVLFPVFAQDAERITAMVPVLESGSVPVLVVDPSGPESDPMSFEVLALPEPRMNVQQLQQTVSDVGAGIGNALAPVMDAGVFPSDADAALFSQEMDKLNAAWGVIGQRIAALPPEDAALLTQLLDNSGALGILEGLGKIDLSASKVPAESSLTHQVFFRVDIVSALLGYASEVTMLITIVSAVAPEPLFTKAAAGALGGIGILTGTLKLAIDAAIPTDLQRVSRVEITPTPVLVEGVSDVVFFGEFKTESNLASELASQKIDEGITTILEFVIKRKIPAAKKLLEDRDKGIESPASEALDEIVGFFSGIFSEIGIDETGLNTLLEKVELSRNDVRLDMSLYRLSVPSIIKWGIPIFPAEEIDKMLGVLEKVGIDVVSESVEVVDSRDVANEDVAVYDPATVQLTGKTAGVMRLKMRAFRFVEPGGESGDEPGEEKKGLLGRLWDRAKQIATIPLDFLKNLHPIFRFFNSMERLDPVYVEFAVKVSGSDVEEPLVVESIRNLTRGHDGLGPSWSPDGRRIAFSSERGANYEIYVMGSDGSNPRSLTNAIGSDMDPSWSPDGRHIAFSSERDGNDEIYVMGSDGSNPRNLTNAIGSDRYPSWSPDGRHIAFSSTRDGRLEIYVMGSDGSNPRRLTNHSGGGWDPSWSPDGRHIAFTSGGDVNSFWESEIYVMGSDGSNPGNLTNQSGIDMGPSWSPDGRRIAFTSDSGANYYNIYVMGSDGSNPRSLTNAIGSDNDPNVMDRYPSWSPDGRHIAFSSLRDFDFEVFQIYVITFQGGGQ